MGFFKKIAKKANKVIKKVAASKVATALLTGGASVVVGKVKKADNTSTLGAIGGLVTGTAGLRAIGGLIKKKRRRK